jgi:hypothetical protein
MACRVKPHMRVRCCCAAAIFSCDTCILRLGPFRLPMVRHGWAISISHSTPLFTALPPPPSLLLLLLLLLAMLLSWSPRCVVPRLVVILRGEDCNVSCSTSDWWHTTQQQTTITRDTDFPASFNRDDAVTVCYAPQHPTPSYLGNWTGC